MAWKSSAPWECGTHSATRSQRQDRADRSKSSPHAIAAFGSYQHGALQAPCQHARWRPRLSASQHFSKSSESLARASKPTASVSSPSRAEQQGRTG